MREGATRLEAGQACRVEEITAEQPIVLRDALERAALRPEPLFIIPRLELAAA